MAPADHQSIEFARPTNWIHGVIAKMQKIAEEFAYTESSVANELLWKALNMKLDESTFAQIAVSIKWGG